MPTKGSTLALGVGAVELRVGEEGKPSRPIGDDGGQPLPLIGLGIGKMTVRDEEDSYARTSQRISQKGGSGLREYVQRVGLSCLGVGHPEDHLGEGGLARGMRQPTQEAERAEQGPEHLAERGEKGGHSAIHKDTGVRGLPLPLLPRRDQERHGLEFCAGQPAGDCFGGDL